MQKAGPGLIDSVELKPLSILRLREERPMAIRTIVWGENIHEQTNEIVRSIYPNGMHNTIADALNRDSAISATTRSART